MKARKTFRKTARRAPRARTGRRRAARVLRAADLMTRHPIVVRENLTVGQLCDLLQEKNINGAPVVDPRGRLVGVVTQEDIIYGAMGHPGAPGLAGGTRPGGPLPGDRPAEGAPDRSPGEAAAGRPGGGRPGRRAAGPAGPPRHPARRVVALLRWRDLAAVPQVPPRGGERPFWSAASRPPDPMAMPVGSIMTSPAISADESTPVTDLCRIMWSLRIHRVPILRAGKVTGLLSSMDLCRAILDGKIRI